MPELLTARPRLRIVLALALLSVLTACAALPGGRRDPRDRFERFNRAAYKFNTALDHAILRPVARGYVKVTPQPVRRSVSNFMSNLDYPVTILNDFLQGQFHDGTTDITRFIVNSVFGIGGLFDPAAREGLDRHDRDFGQTLGKWGVPSGPYLMLPFLGPSTVRDAPAKLVDEYSSPRAYISNQYVRWGLWGFGELNTRANLLNTDQLIDSAYDPYAFVRDAWLQQREFAIHGGSSEDLPDEGEDLPPSDDSDTAPAKPAPTH
jgi:phospholipid-binding lipoprotein MlaA